MGKLIRAVLRGRDGGNTILLPDKLFTVSVLEKPEGDEPYRQVSRPVFLDTGGIDGRQARLRREIDRLKACKERYETQMNQALKARDEHETPLSAHFSGWQERVSDYNVRIKTCWKKYERRNGELAHLASNLLILLALLYDCRLICGENLTTLKTEGRGKGVRGRFRNWRNNTTVRGEVWRVLKYKCHLFGIRARQVEPRGTTHTCPTVVTRRKRITLHLKRIARKRLNGGSGSVAAILPVYGTARVITLPVSISPDLAWPF